MPKIFKATNLLKFYGNSYQVSMVLSSDFSCEKEGQAKRTKTMTITTEASEILLSPSKSAQPEKKHETIEKPVYKKTSAKKLDANQLSLQIIRCKLDEKRWNFEFTFRSVIEHPSDKSAYYVTF